MVFGRRRKNQVPDRIDVKRPKSAAMRLLILVGHLRLIMEDMTDEGAKAQITQLLIELGF
jgi:hypothetical protein